jgi:hypothetical protein
MHENPYGLVRITVEKSSTGRSRGPQYAWNLVVKRNGRSMVLMLGLDERNTRRIAGELGALLHNGPDTTGSFIAGQMELA